MLRHPSRKVAMKRAKPRHIRIFGFAAGALLLMTGIAACGGDNVFPASTNTYPIDVFTAMHYQEGFRTNEPPRFGMPEDGVPVSGRDPAYNPQEVGQLENPIEATDESIDRGQTLFQVNCQVCHGETGQGNGPMAPQFEAYDAARPADLTIQRLREAPDSHFYNVITFGLPPFMPPFGNLIPGSDIWDIVNYIRTLQGQAQ